MALGVLLAAWGAHAQPAGESPNKAAALGLFDEGRRLLDAGDLARACTKLAESQRLDPGGGALLNLALCHEKQGRVATAWAEFRDALRMARLDRRADRIAFAEAHVAALEPRVARVAIAVNEAVPGVQITLNGLPIGEAAWGSPIPVDPGEFVVQAEAPGKRAFTAKRRVAEGQLAMVAVDALDDAPVATQQKRAENRKPAPTANRHTGLGWSIAAGGVTALGVCGAFTWLALDRRNASDRQCPGGQCTAAGVAYNERAQALANYATVAAVVGLAGVGVGLWLLWPSSDEKPHAVDVGIGPGNVQFQARF